MAMDISKHPCFNEGSCKSFGRIHLPVAPKCNVQCGFCNRKYDCVNESRPGVTSTILSPGQAVEYLDLAIDKCPQMAVVGIAGPGDPMANPEATFETLRRIRDKYPEMLLCVSTNGLDAAPYIKRLKELDVTHLTITMCAVDHEITAKVYRWVRFGKRVYRGAEAGQIMLQNQLAALRLAVEADLIVKINCIALPGINDHHILDVARKVKSMGAQLFNLMELCRAPGADFENLPALPSGKINELRDQAAEILPQMRHCQRCRADAVGLLGEDRSAEMAPQMQKIAAGPIEPQQEKPYVAVASREGFLINEHLGQAEQFMVFERCGDEGFKLVASRPAPVKGDGDTRWEKMAETLSDCRAILVSGAGQRPCGVLEKYGIKVYTVEGIIEQGLQAVYEGRQRQMPCRTLGSSCASCSGDATGCG